MQSIHTSDADTDGVHFFFEVLTDLSCVPIGRSGYGSLDLLYNRRK